MPTTSEGQAAPANTSDPPLSPPGDQPDTPVCAKSAARGTAWQGTHPGNLTPTQGIKLLQTLGLKWGSCNLGSAINQKTKELMKTGINQRHSESPNPQATGIFVICGPSNVSVIDIDGTTGMSMAILHQLAGRCNLVAETRKGIHLFFRHHPKLPRAYANPVTKVDVRSSGQTVKGASATDIIFVYPSRYPVPQGEGLPYQWLADGKRGM